MAELVSDLDDAGGRDCLEKECIAERARLARAGRGAACWTAFTGAVFVLEAAASGAWWAIETAVRRRRERAR